MPAAAEIHLAATERTDASSERAVEMDVATRDLHPGARVVGPAAVDLPGHMTLP
jgi:hypothetical protein